MDEIITAIIAFFIGVILTGPIAYDITKETWQRKAVDRGVGEYYFDEEYEPQFRYKEISK